MRALDAQLTLVLTRRCGLRCGWCPQGFEDSDMSPRVLAAAAGLLDRMAPAAPVKLFGGEPLLAPGLVRRAVALVAERSPGRRVELPTNGLALDAAMAGFLRAQPQVEVALSRPCAAAAPLTNVVVNFLLRPGERAEAAVARAGEWLAAGRRRFNVLPAYYTRWSAAELAELRRALRGLSRLFGALACRGVEVVNARRAGPAPLYNGGLTVDTDGRLYASNLFLARAVGRARVLALGDVRRPSLRRAPSARALLALSRRRFGSEVMRSTLAADAALTEFVHGL